VRVLIVPDCFTGTLTAPQAAVAIAAGWARHAPWDELELLPLSDGGPGFLDVLGQALGGRLITVTVPGPLGEPAPAAVLLAQVPDGVVTGYVESAQACGLHLLPPGRRDPGVTTTAGVGSVLQAAVDAGAGRVVVGLGGSGTNDAGAGMLAALGAGPPAVLAAGGAALAGITPADLPGLAAVRERWAGVDVVIASDVDVPLLGFHGASAVFAEQKGASPGQAQALERCLGDFVAAAVAAGAPATLHTAAGAGAAGGLGYGLLLLGGHRVSGAGAVLGAVGGQARIAAADLVVTGEGRLDWQSLRGKVVAGVAAAGLAAGRPVIVLAGQVEVGRREAQAVGIEAAYPVATSPQEVAASLADPAGALASLAQRIARTWSPRR